MAKVLITMLNKQGETLEQGETASAINDGWWEFETAAEGKLIVEAFDLAGNITKFEA